jgi:dienelactone hydrolase
MVLALCFAVFIVTLFASSSHCRQKAIVVPLPEGDGLPGYCFFPGENVNNPWPGVVVAANAGGIKLIQYHTYCRRLAEKGFAVLLIDPSGYPQWLTPGMDTWRRMPYHIWAWINHLSVVARLAMGHGWYVRNIDSAVQYLANHPRVNLRKIAISGFSQSANVALTHASGCSRIRAVVWNNGGWPWVLPYQTERLPPVLIFHGEADGVYNVRYAHKLAADLEAAKRDFECHIYPNERHMFMVYYSLENPKDVDRPALRSSFDILLGFLERVFEIQTEPCRK